MYVVAMGFVSFWKLFLSFYITKGNKATLYEEEITFVISLFGKVCIQMIFR